MESFFSIVAAVTISTLTMVLEGVIRNFAAGVAMRREQRFTVGNIIQVEGIGDVQVVELGMYSVLALDTRTGLYTTINNNDLLSKVTKNYSRTDWYFIVVEIPLGGDEDLDTVDETINTAIEELEWVVFGVETTISLARIEDEKIVLEVKVPVKPTQPRVHWEQLLRRAILKELVKNGVQVGIPDVVRVEMADASTRVGKDRNGTSETND
jgi:small-conductance mechanosensitive channel